MPPVETQRRTKDGRILDIWLTATGLIDRHSGAIELATTERDITERKRTERELRSLHGRVLIAQETERKRLSRDLHDGVGQILSGVKFKLEALSGAILSHPEKTRRQIVDAADTLNHAIFEIRRMSQNLIPSELEDLGLESALTALCRDFSERLAIPLIVRCSDIPKNIDPDLALAIFRIAQEALNNAGKHAKATRMTVSLRRQGKDIELCISDNGRGCAIGSQRRRTHRGMGLNNVRERIQSMGGDLQFRSKLGLGTRLVVRAPLPRSGKGGS